MRISDWSSDVCSSDLQLRALELGCLGGGEEHHVGASHRLWDVATRITERVQESSPGGRQPNLGTIYVVALMQIPKADQVDLMSAFDRALQSGARTPASRDANDLDRKSTRLNSSH